MDTRNDSRAVSRQSTCTSANAPAPGKKLSEKLKMLPKFTGPYFVKNTANTIR
jgi:hypothetical protein